MWHSSKARIQPQSLLKGGCQLGALQPSVQVGALTSLHLVCATLGSAGAQLLVIVEQYVGLLIGATIGAIFLLKFLSPHAFVRFATTALFSLERPQTSRPEPRTLPRPPANRLP